MVYDDATYRFRFAHLSVREYLEAHEDYKPSSVHAFILEKLFLMSRPLHPLAAYSKSRSPPYSWVSNLSFLFDQMAERSTLDETNGTEHPNHLHKTIPKYLCENWGFHYGHVEQGRRKALFFQHAKTFFVDEHRLNRAIERYESFDNEPDRNHCMLQLAGFDLLKISDRAAVAQACKDNWQELFDYLDELLPASVSRSFAWRLAYYIGFAGTSRIRKSIRRVLPSSSIEPFSDASDLEMTAIGSLDLRTDVAEFYRVTKFEVNIMSHLMIGHSNPVADIIDRYGAFDTNFDHTGKLNPLLAAVVFGAPIHIIQEMLGKGANPSLVSDLYFKDTPLTAAVQLRHQIMFRTLMDWDCGSGLTSEQEKLLLSLTMERDCQYAACTLILHGADPLVKDEMIYSEWMMLLNLIALSDGTESTSRALEKRSNAAAGPMIPKFGRIFPHDAISEVMICLAAQLQHLPAFHALLDMGVDPTCPGIPAGVWKRTTNVGSVAAIRAQFTDTQTKRYKAILGHKQSPLAWVALTGNVSLAELIVSRGIDPNLSNSKNQSAIFSAARRPPHGSERHGLEDDKIKVIQMLLAKGADVGMTDIDGKTAMWHAMQAGLPKIVKFLRAQGCPVPAERNTTEQEKLLWKNFMTEKRRFVRHYWQELESLGLARKAQMVT